jgi:hypothetical protein
MFDLQGTSLCARYCIKGSGFVQWSGSIKTTSVITDSSGKIFSEKSSQWGTDGYTSGMPGDCSTSYAYDEIKSGFIPGSTYTLTVNSSLAGSSYSLTKSFTIAGGSTPATKSEAVIPQGLGGYAVVHPNGKVCGVIVATSADPYANGGTMPIEYMGCPVGSGIIFQTNPSPTGNVAGWSGENVTYNGSEFIIKSGTSDSATVQTKIQGGVATDSNGRVWDTGIGQTLVNATATTSTSDTSTATTSTSDTSTATTNEASSSSGNSPSSLLPANPITQVLGTTSELQSMVIRLLDDLREVRAINRLIQRLDAITRTTSLKKITLPGSTQVDESVTSHTPNVCSVSAVTIMSLSRGTCVVAYTITDSTGNKFTTLKEIYFRK